MTSGWKEANTFGQAFVANSGAFETDGKGPKGGGLKGKKRMEKNERKD